jgi:hypothetical protein
LGKFFFKHWHQPKTLLGDFLGDFSLSLGDFFTKTSGHPGTSWPQRQIFRELLTKKKFKQFFLSTWLSKVKNLFTKYLAIILTVLECLVVAVILIL